MSFLIRTVPRLSQQCIRQLSVSQALRDAGPERVDVTELRKKQKHFQIEDGTPVYLKGGVGDKILFNITAVLCVIGLGMTFQLYYELSVPKKE